jgi:hypothetical protein
MKIGLLAVVAVASLTGCGTQLRYETSRAWYPAPDVEPATAPAAGPTPAAADPQPNAARSTFYLTYWEGKCCFEGAPRVIRCAVQPDNSLACTREVLAERALQP